MILPGYTAGASLDKTSGRYCITASNTPTDQVLPQQTGDCVNWAHGCFAGCASSGNSAECRNACTEGFVDCSGQGGGGGDDLSHWEPSIVERSGCFRDSTSSTGWRLRECQTVAGAPGRATQCHWSEECDAPGCGPCRCTQAPDGTRACTQQCFTYSPTTGATLTHTRPCTPQPPLGTSVGGVSSF
jgi:hypothetical protein